MKTFNEPAKRRVNEPKGSFYKETGKSWYIPRGFNDKEKYYFWLIENSFRVQYPDGGWDFIKLQPHQREFHSQDIALLRGKSKNNIDIKSRNTSFTVDSVLRLLTGNYYYHDEVVAIVRINENKVKEIIKQIMSIIKHIRPIVMPDGSLFPFNPEKITNTTMSIDFTDIGVVFQGYTSASPESAENIRGIRTTRGLLDECFYKTTLITTDEGSKEIYKIKPGDLVESYNTKTGIIEYKKVLVKSKKAHTVREMVNVSITNNGIAATCTLDHPFYILTNNGIRIKKAKNLKKGDKLISNNKYKKIKIGKVYNYKTTEVKKIEIIKKRCCIYNLEVEDNHNYFAGRMLVHNCNFYPYWSSIWGAMKGASRGADKEGNIHFQVTMGTTLRGETKFLQWYRDIEKKVGEGKLDDYTIFKFPVFDPEVFDPNVQPIDQPELIPIVFWHDMKRLNNEWNEDVDKFMEEYMAVIAPGEGNYYKLEEVQEVCSIEEMNLYDAKTYSDKNFDLDNSINILGIDPAGDGVDFFSIQCINHNLITKEQTHFYSFNMQHVSDPIEAMRMCEETYEILQCRKCRIDGNDLGYFIATGLKKKYGGYAIEVMRGSVKVKDNDITIPIKEFLHTNLKLRIKKKTIQLVISELILEHFKMWKNDYSGERSKRFGHGDSVIGIGLAALPLNWRNGGKEPPIMERTHNNTKEELEGKKFYGSLKERIGYYRKNTGKDSFF